MSAAMSGSGWMVSTGFDLLHHTLSTSKEAAQRTWAREFANIGPGNQPQLNAVLDTIWREHGEKLGMKVVPVQIEETPL